MTNRQASIVHSVITVLVMALVGLGVGSLVMRLEGISTATAAFDLVAGALTGAALVVLERRRQKQKGS